MKICDQDLKVPASQVKPPFFPYGPTTLLTYSERREDFFPNGLSLDPLTPAFSEVEVERETQHPSVPDPTYFPPPPKAVGKPTPQGQGYWTKTLEGPSALPYKNAKCRSMDPLPAGATPSKLEVLSVEGVGSKGKEKVFVSCWLQPPQALMSLSPSTPGYAK